MTRRYVLVLILLLALGDALAATCSLPVHSVPAYAALPGSPTPTSSHKQGIVTPTPRSPSLPEDHSQTVEEIRAQRAMETALIELMDVAGPNSQFVFREIAVEGHWAYGSFEWSAGREKGNNTGHVTAHLLPDRTWQAVVLGDGISPQWLDGAPENPLEINGKSPVRIAAVEADGLKQSKVTPTFPPTMTPAPLVD